MHINKLTNIAISSVIALSTIALPALADKATKSAKGAAKTTASAQADKTAAAGAKPTEMQVQIVSFTKSVKQGDKATVSVKTDPGAKVDITVKLKSGKSSNADLKQQKADATGNASWTWTIAKNTSPGPIDFTVNASYRNKKAEASGTITVEKADNSAAAAPAAGAASAGGGKKKGK